MNIFTNLAASSRKTPSLSSRANNSPPVSVQRKTKTRKVSSSIQLDQLDHILTSHTPLRTGNNKTSPMNKGTKCMERIAQDLVVSRPSQPSGTAF